jgi:hypothetical protein
MVLEHGLAGWPFASAGRCHVGPIHLRLGARPGIRQRLVHIPDKARQRLGWRVIMLDMRTHDLHDKRQQRVVGFRHDHASRTEMVLTFFSCCINIDSVVNTSRIRRAVLLIFAPRLEIVMTDPVFQKAYENVRNSYSYEAWNALTPREITEAIYQEIRRIDAASHMTEPPPATY